MIDFEKLLFSGKFDELLKNTSDLIDKGGREEIKGLLWEGRARTFMGDLEKGKLKLNKALKKYKWLSLEDNRDNLKLFASILHYQGGVMHNNNEYASTIEKYSEALRIRKEINDEREIGKTLHNLGLLYLEIGEYEKASDYLRQTYDLAITTNKDVDILYALSGLLQYYIALGDVSNYKKYLHELKSIPSISEGYNKGIMIPNYEGIYYEFDNNLETALKYYKKGLKLSKNAEQPLAISTGYTHVIRTLNNLNERNQAKKYLEKFRNLEDEMDNNIISSQFKISWANYLKGSSKFSDKSEAIKMFNKLIKNSNVESTIKLDAMRGHIELLLEELELSKTKEKMDEIKKYLEKYHRMINSEVLYADLVKFIILEAKFDILIGEFNLAIAKLEQAKEFANQKNLMFLEKIVEKEINEFKAEFSKWQELVDNQTDLSERIKLSRIKSYIKKARGYLKP